MLNQQAFSFVWSMACACVESLAWCVCSERAGKAVCPASQPQTKGFLARTFLAQRVWEEEKKGEDT